MKKLISNSFRFLTASSVLLCCLLANHAGAVTTTWDPVGTATVANSHGFTSVSLNGTWENNSWSTAQGGQVTPQAWVENSAAVWAVHSGTGTPAFTVTMNANHTVAGMFSGPLTYNPCTATIQGTGTMLLPAGLQGFSFNSNNSDPGLITIATVMADADPAHPCEYTAQGSGQVFLHGNNTWSGGTLLGYSGGTFSGIINFNNTASFGTGGICVSNTGTSICALVAEGSAAMTIANNFTNPASTLPRLHIVAPSGGLTFSGEWDVNGNAQTGPSAGTVTFSGLVKGAGGVGTCPGVSSPTTLVLSHDNTYTGGTTNWLGTLSVNTIGDSSPSAIGPSSAANLAFCGGTFQYTGSGAATTARPCWLTAASTIDLTSGSLELSGTFKSTASANVLTKTSAGKLTLSGGGDNSSLAIKVNAGTVVLNKASGSSVHALGGASTVSGGTLQLGNTGGGGDQIYSGVVLTVSSGAFDMNGQSEGMTTLSLSGTGISSGGALVNSAASTTSTITGTGASGITLAANASIGGVGSITVPSGTVITGTKSLTYVGTGTLTLSSANNYSGGTIVSSGTLLVNNASGSATGTSTVTVNSPGILTGTGIISGATTVNAGGTLTMVDGTPGEILTFGGNLGLAGTTSLEIEQDIGIADEVVSAGIITLGGNLTVVQTDTGDPFVLGDTFQLFGGTLAGQFTSYTLPALSPGLAWDTSQLGLGGNGQIKVICDGTLLANAGAPQAICFGSVATLGGSPTASGGSGAGTYTYSWAPATGLSSATDPNPTATPTATTTYTVTVTDVNGCTAMSSVTVTAGAIAISAQPVNQTACSGSTATFSVTATGAGLSYSWANNNNLGWGSGNQWSVSGSGSTFRSSSTDNDSGDTACNSFSSALDINSPSGNALGMYGGTSGDEVATRTFTALTAGQVVSVDFDNGNVDNASKVGFSLQTSGGADVLQFYFLGGAANYKYWDTNLGEQDTGIPFQRTGLRVQFALVSATTYGIIVTPCGGTPTTFTGTYSGTIAQLKLFNQNTSGGIDRNIYFNNFLVGGYSDNADNYTGDYAGQNKGNQPIGSGNGGSTYTTPVLTVGDDGSQYQVTVYGCGGSVVSTPATVTVNPAPTASAGGDQTICSDTSSTAPLGGVVGGGATGGTWTTSGTGSFAPDANTPNATYMPSPADITAGTVTLTLTTTGQLAPCGAVTAQVVVTINKAATTSAGGNQTICSDGITAPLGGVVGGGATGGAWTTSGTGTFAPNANTLNATYAPSPDDITAGTVTLTLTSTGQLAPCGAATALVVVTINPAATASAGGNQAICSDVSSTAPLGGVVGGAATGGTWTTSGTGTFVPDANTLNATYMPSPADVTAGTVTLTLTATGQLAPCVATAQVVVTIHPAATASAGANQTICSDGATAPLGGIVGGGATGGTWSSSGTGSFAPNANSLNATYTPSPADITAGTVTLTLTSTGQLAPCGAATALVVVTINPAATASAGGNQTICSDSSSTGPLGGVVGGAATGGTWTTSGTGSFAPDEHTLNGTYMPSPADVTAGTVTLTLTATGQLAPCVATAQVVVTIHKAATASAGGDQTICSSASTAGLGGVVGGGATGGTWSSSGTGSFAPNANNLNATYAPSPADITSGTVTLTLTSTGQLAPCGAATALVVVTINPAATVNAGPNQTVCAGSPTVTLAGSFGGGASSATWSGAGTFTPNTATLNAAYTPTPGEITAGTATVTLTSDDPAGPCGPVSSSMTITIGAPPTAAAGSDQTVCAGGTPVTIGGSPTASGGTGPYTYSWSPATGLSDATVSNPTASVGSTTTYTVTVTDHNGCTANASVVLTVPPLPNIESTTVSGSDVTLVWDSLAGQVYRVQYTTDLPTPPTAATWTDLTPDVTATGATATYTDTGVPATQRFYRIFIVCP